MNHGGLPTGASDRSVTAWVKTSQNNGNAQSIFNWGTPTATARFGLLVVNGTTYFVGENQDVAGSGTPFADGAWHHVAVTYNGFTLRVYVDAALNSAGGFPLNTTGRTLRIGETAVTHGSEPFNGAIDDVRIYSVVLTAAEIRTIAAHRGY